MSEVECPHCDCEVVFDTDDGFGREEEREEELQCDECGLYFLLETSIVFNYNSKKSCHLNKVSHNWLENNHDPAIFEFFKTCKNCEEINFEFKKEN